MNQKDVDRTLVGAILFAFVAGILAIVISLCTGCITLPDMGDLFGNDKPDPEPVVTNTAPEVVEGNTRFLWKPDSDTRPGACVLLPCQIRQEDIYNKGLTINGDKNQVYEHRQGYANGNRIHLFLHQKGWSYGGTVIVELPLRSGDTLKWTVPNGGARYEKEYKNIK